VGTVVGTARKNISMVGCCRLPFGSASRSVRVLLKVPYLHYFSPLPRPRWMRKPVLSVCPSLCPRADLKALSGGQDQLHRLTSLLAHRGPPRQSPLTGSSPSAASAMHKTTGRLLRSPHRTPLPSSHFAADGQSARPSASFAPPLLVAHATTMRPSTPCGLVVFIGCLLRSRIYLFKDGCTV